ncbi:TroA family protein [Xanthobacter versatilis]|uniref:hypothetical protein n=1 Tax=Xanthobacter autotrophicus (strain ATCC BAA-1158 / Py2) TaxID=78245 RepID=UPI00372796FD
MRIAEMREFDDGGKLASQAYRNALRKLQDACEEVFGEQLETQGERAMALFESALESLKNRLSEHSEKRMRLFEILDIEPGEDLTKALLYPVDIDTLAPKQVKDEMYAEFHRRGKGRFDLRPILRRVLDELFTERTIRRPNVGANRHWPRLRQYIREIEDETNWLPDGQGVRLVNKGGRGPVAREPRDPGRLSVIIDPDYL